MGGVEFIDENGGGHAMTGSRAWLVGSIKAKATV
jgi:hypothetical protein